MKTNRRRFSFRINQESGFTLLETLIGLLVFTVGILAVATMSTMSYNQFTQSRRTGLELYGATANIEALKEVRYGETQYLGEDATPKLLPGTANKKTDYLIIDDATVLGTKLITSTSTGMGRSPFVVRYTKPEIR